MRFLVVKHVRVEGLGLFGPPLEAAGIGMDTLELEAGERLPPLDGYAALWAMGGPMNVADEAEYPWLVEEKALIREVVRRRLPFLGVCLGAQLLADALGGEVGPMATPEIGVAAVRLSPAGREHPLMRGLGESITALHWHGQEVRELLAGSMLLAGSGSCRVQAFAVGESAFGLQFHTEASASAVEAWAALPGYRADLEVVGGSGNCEHLRHAVLAEETRMARQAEILVGNFLGLVRSARG